jgi:MSHA biogenesis protein MshN
MSLINKMLRDLDKRHASQFGTAAPAGDLSQHMHAVPKRTLASDFFWRTMAMLMLFAVGWVAWLVWQLTPHPIVTDLVYQSSREKASAPAASSRADPAPAPQSAAAQPPALPAGSSSAAPAAVQPAPALPAASASVGSPTARPPQRSEKINVDMLRLATELTTPIPQRSSRASSPRSASKAPVAAARTVSAPLAGEADAAPGKIDRRSNTSSRNRAENEFRRAVNLMNQGRIAEGMDGFRRALEIDPGHEAARQTLVALLIETKRVDQAALSLQEGLAADPGNTGFAMLLARIMVESNDIPTALLVLQRHAAPPDRNPDFHAFAGALYQRLDRHKEAIEQYQAALRIAPSAGVWWLGLGISFQAAGRPKDAQEAFTRAKSAGNLSPDLLSFVDQRLRQLQ